MFRGFILISVLVCASGDKLPRLEGRIVGGEETTIQKFPHEVSIEHEGDHFCGGSIISKTVIVTAAHCMNGRTTKDIQVHAGSTRKSDKGVRIPLKQIIVHEDYDQIYQDNDIALVTLANPLNFSDTIKPIDLAESGVPDVVGAIAYVSGWGIHNEHGLPPDILSFVAVYIIDSSECSEDYKNMGFKIHESMICAGVRGGGKDACLEDSGSPLIVEGKLVGIVSWGVGCARKEYPGVYARVSYLREWIDKNRPDK